jgi:uncharacterized protein YgbK (DUF1537 family)
VTRFAIVLHREILPGIPLGLRRRPDAAPLQAITNAGGFGPEDAFLRLAAALHAVH